MSTPSVTILKNLVLNWETDQMEEETIATFYRHYDGYPSCHAVDIANSLIVASRTKPEHIDFSGASVERDILNNRNWCQHFLKAMCMADADIEFIGETMCPLRATPMLSRALTITSAARSASVQKSI